MDSRSAARDVRSKVSANKEIKKAVYQQPMAVILLHKVTTGRSLLFDEGPQVSLTDGAFIRESLLKTVLPLKNFTLPIAWIQEFLLRRREGMTAPNAGSGACR